MAARRRKAFRIAFAACLMICGLFLSSCRVFGRTVQVPVTGPDATQTSVTETVPVEVEGPTQTPEPTATWTATPTDTPTPVPPTPTPHPPTATPRLPTATPTLTLTATPVTPSPTPTCAATPQWGIGDVWRNKEVHDRLGCPVGEQIGVPGEELYLQRGHMLWRPDNGLIYILYSPYVPDGWGAFPDTYLLGDPELDPTMIPPTPSIGGPKLYQPPGRFGKLWRANPWMKEKLGWAILMGNATEKTGPIIRFKGAAQDFEGGVLFWNGNVCFVLRTDDMSWTMY